MASVKEEKLNKRRRTKVPWTLAIDTREQAPWDFKELKTVSSEFVVETTRLGLRSGDYAIEGLERIFVVERKSLEDLYSTLTHDRDRFKREMTRLFTEHESAAVIIEASWDAIKRPKEHDTAWRSQAWPQSIIGSIFSMIVHYPTIHWLWMPTRSDAAWACFQLLRMAYDRFMEELINGPETKSN